MQNGVKKMDKCARTECKNELPDYPYTWIVGEKPSPLLFCSPICIAKYESRIKDKCYNPEDHGIVERLREWFEPWKDKDEDDYQGSPVDLRIDILEILGENK